MKVMKKYTGFGVLAVILWSTNIAFTRRISEAMGVFTSGTFIFLSSGIIATLFLMFSRHTLFIWKGASQRYVFGCGILFVINTVSLQIATGLAANHTQVIIVGILNYLWTALSLIFSIWIFGYKPRWFLFIGFLLALGGMWSALSQDQSIILRDVLPSAEPLLVYGLAFIAAITWGLYSNLSRKWTKPSDTGLVPVFLLGSGILMGIFRIFIPETSTMNPSGLWQLGYMVFFPTILAYVFWDLAMRKGQIIFVISFSYLTPLLSTLISSLKLGVRITPIFFLSAGLIILGAVICRLAIPTDSNS
jgi:drug/metabolite transporter (DMT)-like permease